VAEEPKRRAPCNGGLQGARSRMTVLGNTPPRRRGPVPFLYGPPERPPRLGELVEPKPASEAGFFMRCPACGGYFDTCDLAQVIAAASDGGRGEVARIRRSRPRLLVSCDRRHALVGRLRLRVSTICSRLF
jgi:hypothetical protein